MFQDYFLEAFLSNATVFMAFKVSELSAVSIALFARATPKSPVMRQPLARNQLRKARETP